MVCQDGHFIVENVSFYKDAALGTDLTAEADWKRRGIYIGPQVCTISCFLLLHELCADGVGLVRHP
jgi:complement component 1 Q subcomponent-binding protein